MKEKTFTEKFWRKFAEEKYPYMRDALALFYASSETGNKNAAKKAREVAYAEEEKPLSLAKDKNPSTNAGSFYEDYQKRVREQQSNSRNNYPAILQDLLKSSSGKLPYIDLTSDGSGLDDYADPTPLEAAQMVQYVADVMAPGKKISEDGQENAVGNWKWTGLYAQNDEGLDMGIFEKETNGKTTYVIVNAGSNFKINGFANLIETSNDWLNNFKQPAGASKDMVYSIGVAKKFVKEHPDANIIFVGYSKGGAEAAANAVATGKKAILFNPAKANLSAYKLDGNSYDGEMVSYVVDGEALGTYTSWLPFEMPAKEIVIGKDNDADISITERVKRHLLEQVIKALKEEMAQ